jgi:uncharacterized protein
MSARQKPAAPSGPWSQSLYGHAYSLTRPHPSDVRFCEIIETLSTINRLNGSAQRPVSVALHSLVADDCCKQLVNRLGDEARMARPYVLLHDFHEAFVGDITTPVATALARIAGDLFRISNLADLASSAVRDSLSELKDRWDDAIWQAAALQRPSPEIRQIIKACDAMALKAERTAFLKTAPHPWHESIETAEVLRRNVQWIPPEQAVRTLKLRLLELLPHLSGHF